MIHSSQNKQKSINQNILLNLNYKQKYISNLIYRNKFSKILDLFIQQPKKHFPEEPE